MKKAFPAFVCFLLGCGSPCPSVSGSSSGAVDAGVADAPPASCQYRDLATEPCDPHSFNPDPTCGPQCCTEMVQPTDPPVPPMAYCVMFTLPGNCFDAAPYPVTGPNGEQDAGTILITGFAWCAEHGSTCGACFDPWLGCWTQGCAYTH